MSGTMAHVGNACHSREQFMQDARPHLVQSRRRPPCVRSLLRAIASQPGAGQKTKRESSAVKKRRYLDMI